MTNEPLITVASITAGVTVLLSLLLEFGVSLTDGQQTAIMAAVAFLAPFLVAGVVRGKVTPTSKFSDAA